MNFKVAGMAEIIDETGSVVDDVSASEPTTETWMEPVPLKYRKKRAWLALGIGVILSVALVSMQLNNGRPLGNLWLSVIPFAIGLLRWRVWLTRESVRKYASTTRLLSKKERFNKTAWSILGFLVGTYLLMLGLAMGRNAGFIVLGIFIMVCSVFMGLVQYSRKEESIITKEGAEAKARVEMETWWAKFLARLFTLEHWWMRYPFAGLLLYGAYRAFLDTAPGSGFWALMYAIAALYIARKVFAVIAVLAVLGLIGWGIFGAVAALPVSVAVIIGAIIIAGAVNSK